MVLGIWLFFFVFLSKVRKNSGTSVSYNGTENPWENTPLSSEWRQGRVPWKGKTWNSKTILANSCKISPQISHQVINKDTDV